MTAYATYALRAFEAAARHESFSRAADELFVTHGAVSHQIRALEADLGVTLFARDGKRVRLSDIGRQYATEVRATLSALAEATRRHPEQKARLDDVLAKMKEQARNPALPESLPPERRRCSA